MAAEGLDCAIALGADNVNHLCGYWRYFGVLVLGADGERTLIVMRTRCRSRPPSDADYGDGYGERGFGSCPSTSPRHRRHLCPPRRWGSADRRCVGKPLTAADRIGASVSCSDRPGGRRSTGIRLIKDDESTPRQFLPAGPGGRGGAQAPPMSTAAQSAAQIAYGGPIESLAVRPERRRGVLPIGGRRTIEEGDPAIADVVVRAGGYGATLPRPISPDRAPTPRARVRFS